MNDTADILTMGDRPTAINGVHEGFYRSYGLLQWILSMLDQGMPSEFVVEFGRAALALPPREMALSNADGVLVEIPGMGEQL